MSFSHFLNPDLFDRVDISRLGFLFIINEPLFNFNSDSSKGTPIWSSVGSKDTEHAIVIVDDRLDSIDPTVWGLT